MGVSLSITKRSCLLINLIFQKPSTYFVLFYYNLGLQYVLNGCIEEETKPDHEKHVVRCCSMYGDTCVTPQDCKTKKTYHDAKILCIGLNMRLCAKNEIHRCCGDERCDIDNDNSWISPDQLKAKDRGRYV